MTMAAFDTVTVAKRLSDRYGFEREQAEGIAVTVHEGIAVTLRDGLVGSVATKEDLALLRKDVEHLRGDMDSLRKEMKSSEERVAAQVAAEIKSSENRLEARIQASEDRLEARIDVAVGDMRKELAEQRKELVDRTEKHFRQMLTFMIGIAGVAIAVFKFLP